MTSFVQRAVRSLRAFKKYLANAAGPVPLVLDLRITHDRFGSSSDPNLNGKLHYPTDVDRSLNEAAADKIRKYRAYYNNPRLPVVRTTRPLVRTTRPLAADATSRFEPP